MTTRVASPPVMAHCYRCGKLLPLSRMRPIPRAALTPLPHFEKVPYCISCTVEMTPARFRGSPSQVRRRSGPWFVLACLLLVSRYEPGGFPLGPLLALIGIPAVLVVWRSQRAIRPDRPWVLNRRMRGSVSWTKQVSAPKDLLLALLMIVVSMLLLGAVWNHFLPEP